MAYAGGSDCDLTFERVTNLYGRVPWKWNIVHHTACFPQVRTQQDTMDISVLDFSSVTACHGAEASCVLRSDGAVEKAGPTRRASVHIVGTLRANRGSESKYQWNEKVGKAQTDALKAKPLHPDRIKARVTADEAQVITVAVFDKKGFQMIDTYHQHERLTPYRLSPQ